MSRKLKDKKRIEGSGRHDWEKMRNVVRELMNDRALPAKYRVRRTPYSRRCSSMKAYFTREAWRSTPRLCLRCRALP